MAAGEAEGGELEELDEQACRARRRTTERCIIGTADQDYDRLDLVIGLPLVPYRPAELPRRGDWPSPRAALSTIVYTDGSGYDTTWPRLCRRGRATVQMSDDNLSIGAVAGGPPPGRRQAVGQAERRAFLQALRTMNYVNHIVRLRPT